MIAARPAVLSVRASAVSRADPLAVKAAGVAFVVIFSALFWMGVAAAAGYVMGYGVSAKALVALGSAVALFLTAVCAPVMLRG